VKPVVTSAEMRSADDAAMRRVTHEALVERAGFAVALEAARLLPHVYGAHVAVLCGPGSNGADGVVAARHLQRRGAVSEVLEVGSLPPRLEGFDLVVDAAFGTGLSRRFDAPELDDSVPVLAVDIASGVDPDTGLAAGRSLRATRTVAMGARKRGHLLADGAELSGSITVAPLGIDVVDAEAWLVEDADLSLLPPLARTDHKWRRSVVIVAGSPGVLGAPGLACDGALSVQAGMVLLCAPDVSRRRDGPWPPEVVRLPASANDVEKVVLDALERARALVMGPGLGRSAKLQRTVTELLRATREPVVLDADALHLVDADTLLARQSRGGSPVVLTPHDGEFAAMFGAPPGTDRFAAARDAASRTGCTVVLKGATTVVASPAPSGLAMLAVDAGTPDLATPGTGDVLAGIIGGLLARGVPAHLAGALGAHVHGRAGASLGARCRATLLGAAVASFLAERRDDEGATRAG
jgi:ADP-dependent NAD(P)H-hydrate dehydratase / NAD(P)H-hydrate epimerase